MKRNHKKALCLLLTSSMCVSVAAPAFAGDKTCTDLADIAVGQYTGTEDQTGFIKISHPEKDVSAREPDQKNADGLLDYLGDSKLGVTGVDPGADGQGDRGQTYTWCGVAYGDWMYLSTQFNSMMATIDAMDTGLGHDFSPEMMDKLLKALYSGDFFTGEEDGGTPKSTLCKLNVKTGELKIIMSKDKNNLNAMFRNALEYKGRLYFCGSVNGLPCVYELDPKTDEFKNVFYDKSLEDPKALYESFRKDKISPTIRGLTTFKDYIVINCVGADANPYIAVSNHPSDGMDSFVKIASAWEEGTDNDTPNRPEGELLGYPACHLYDSIYGGSIWEMAEYNGKLYVSMCTGTPDNAKENGNVMQSFAIMRGECNGDIEDRDAWTWTPIAGDPADGAKYTFGIDPERTRSGACSMAVFDDHLYIGEYNDTEIALINILFGFDLKFMSDNLEQSVSLYRMDESETFEKVMGDPTEMFPTSLSGIDQSGFGAHESQYIWQMNVFDDKLYLGTFDETNLIYPAAQISNGELFQMSAEEWKIQLKYLGDFIQAVIESKQEEENKPEKSADAPKDAKASFEKEAPAEEAPAENDVLSAEETPAENAGLSAASLDAEAIRASIPDFINKNMKEHLSLDTKENLAFIKQAASALTASELNALSELSDGMEEAADLWQAGTLSEIAAPSDEALSVLVEKDPVMEVDSLADMQFALVVAAGLLEQDASLTVEQKLSVKIDFAKLILEIAHFYEKHYDELPPFIRDLYDEFVSNETVQKAHELLRLLYYMKDSVSGFDMYVSENGTDFKQITNNGLGDPYNHGLRVICPNNSEENPWMTVGTANPFYGTQVWRMESDSLKPYPVELPETEAPDAEKVPIRPDMQKPDTNRPETDKPDADKPAKPDTVKPSRPSKGGGGSSVPSKTEKPAPENADKEADKTVIVLQIGNKEIKVNGKAFTNDVAPVIVNERTMVPIRVITETLGGKVGWNNDTKTVTLNIDGKKLVMTVGKAIADFDTPPVIMDERTYVPMRYIAEKLGAKVDWNGDTKTITITK